MTTFYDAAISFPTVVYSTLLGVVMVHWLLALIGVVDLDSAHLDAGSHLHADAHADDVGDLASYLVALGLNGVPFSVVVTLLVLFSWTITCLAAMWLLPLVPTSVLHLVGSLLIMLLAFAVSLPLTARLIRPMRGLFVTHVAMSNAALVGQCCRVLTSHVDEQFGRAEVATLGAGVNIKVWAETPNHLRKGSLARILEHDELGARYLIVAEETNP